MRVAALSLTDFRNHAQLELGLGPGVTALIGPNGQGKTNIVEAIGYVATLGSHRVATDEPLVRHGASHAVVRADLRRDDRSVLVEIEINPGRANRARLNRGPVPRPREVLGLLRTVLFAPEDLALVRGDPTERRRFLDDLLVVRSPRMAAVRADYDRVLKQRNALLKTSGAARRGGSSGDLRTLDVWDHHLATHGAELLTARTALLAELTPWVEAAHSELSDGRAAGLEYRSSLGPEVELHAGAEMVTDALLAGLAQVRPRELERGITLLGPHRDDLVLSVGALPAKGYASHGEGWTLVLALRLGAYRMLRQDGVEPVLILDDVFAELDARRRRLLVAGVADAEQVLVTAAVADDVPEELLGARIDVMAGEATRVR